MDLNCFLQFVLFALAAALGFLYLVRNTASRYFVVDSNFAATAADFSSDRGVVTMATPAGGGDKVSDACAVCGLRTTKHCARCKMVKYWYECLIFIFIELCMCICFCETMLLLELIYVFYSLFMLIAQAGEFLGVIHERNCVILLLICRRLCYYFLDYL